MRAHGIASNAATIKPAPARLSKTERRDSSTTTSKKRKTDQFVEENTATDDDETFNVKPDPGNESKEILRVKEEEMGQLNMDEAVNLMQYYGNSSYASSSSMGAEQNYDFGGSSASLGSSSMAGSSGGWGMSTLDAYEFTTPYSSSSKHIPRFSIAPSVTSSYHATFYHPTSKDSQGGGAESPLLVE